jgi:hypothetical protein
MVLYGRRRAAKHRRHGHDRIEDPLISLGTGPFFDSSSRLLSGSAARFRRRTCSTLLQKSAPLARVAAGLSVFLVVAPHRPVRVRLRRVEHISTVVLSCGDGPKLPVSRTVAQLSPTPRNR